MPTGLIDQSLKTRSDITGWPAINAASWPLWLRYVLAVLAVGVVTGIRRTLPMQGLPFLLYLPSLFAVGFFLRRGPGIVATFLSGLIAFRYFVPLATTPSLYRDQLITLGFYIAISMGLVLVCDRLRSVLLGRKTDLIATRAALDALEASEAFLRSVLESSPDCIKVLDRDARILFMSERGKQAMEVADFSQIEGCPWPDFWQGEDNASARTAIEMAKAGQTGRFQGIAKTMLGTPRWWDVAVSPIIDADGTVVKILSVSRDITETRRVDEERMRLASLIEQSGDFIAMTDTEGRMVFLNDAAQRMVGLSPGEVGDTQIVDCFAPDDRNVIAGIVMPEMEKTGWWEGELRLRNFKTGDDIPVLYNVFPIRDASGVVLGYGTVTKDITEQKRAEAQQRLLNHELAHRLKNTLAMVQAIANQTMRRAGSIAEARTAFDSRLIALGKAQDVLTGTHWERAEFGAVVQSALAPHGGDSGRFEIGGPPLLMSARCSLALSLALHELATNAAKYGALSNEAGKVVIRWWIETVESSRRLHMRWEEQGGPAVVSPQRSGFGSFMIERSLAGYFKGSARIEYLSGGVVFLLEGPVTMLESEFASGEAEILLPKRTLTGGGVL